jgi:predicted DNA-binding antitoxin AbrB/MazE fold protein
MAEQVRAIYEKGVLRPLRPLNLREHQVDRYSLDSSALVKRYVAEMGSHWIQSLAEPSTGHTLFISTISQFRYDLDTQYQVIELDQTLVELAGEVVLRHLLRHTTRCN